MIISGYRREVVSAEGAGGETGTINEVGFGIITPRESDCDGLGDFGVGDQDGIPFDFGIGRDECWASQSLAPGMGSPEPRPQEKVASWTKEKGKLPWAKSFLQLVIRLGKTVRYWKARGTSAKARGQA